MYIKYMLELIKSNADKSKNQLDRVIVKQF